jgi:hypothetical protein
VIVGADRIAANGDTANKIGTYSVAALARIHHIPFYVAAPATTFDLSIADRPNRRRRLQSSLRCHAGRPYRGDHYRLRLGAAGRCRYDPINYCRDP